MAAPKHAGANTMKGAVVTKGLGGKPKGNPMGLLDKQPSVNQPKGGGKRSLMGKGAIGGPKVDVLKKYCAD